jgi:hypothetical protein
MKNYNFNFEIVNKFMNLMTISKIEIIKPTLIIRQKRPKVSLTIVSAAKPGVKY